MNLDDIDQDYEEEGEEAAGEEQQETVEREEPQTVPLAAHIEERNKLKAKIEELEARNSRFSGLEAEIREMRARLQAKPEPQPEPEPEPDYFEDPKAYIDKRTGSLVDQLKQLDSKAKQYEQTQQQQNQMQQMLAHVASVEKEFIQQNPDYLDALNWMREQRRKELELMFPQATAGQVATQLQNEEMQAAYMALQSRRNPAEVAYKLAATRGYVRKQQAPQPEERDLQNAGSLGSSGDGRLSELVNAEADEFDIALREMFG